MDYSQDSNTECGFCGDKLNQIFELWHDQSCLVLTLRSKHLVGLSGQRAVWVYNPYALVAVHSFVLDINPADKLQKSSVFLQAPV